MSRQWINELEIGQKVDMEVRVASSAVHVAQNKSSYLALTLADRTGEITAKRWNTGAKEHEHLANINFARIVGKVDEHNGCPQIILTTLPVDIGLPDDLSDFLMCSPLAFDDIQSRLHQHIASVCDSRLNALLHSIFFEDTERAKAFMEYPAALNMHHAFRHGLLHHTLEVTDLVAAMADQQIRWGGHPVQRDLAVTGALLHDIGKTEEMEEQDFNYHFSEAGSLHGHIMQGSVYLIRKIAALKRKRSDLLFPKALEQMLVHLICSHHGKGEWGSPKSPMTAEALLIHMADKTSADLYYMEEARLKAATGQAVVHQSKLDNGFGGKGRYVFVGDMGMVGAVNSDAIREEEPFALTISREARLPILRIIHTQEPENQELFTRSLPLVGKIAAGQPLLDSESLDGQLCVEASLLKNGKGVFYLLRVQGDSMTGDGIQDGDLIVAKHQNDASDGDLVVALLEDGATVKRLMRKDGKVSLMPSNPTYQPIHVLEGADLKIQGLVVGIARSTPCSA